MTSDRLNELHRQRAMVQQQLEWLDREIAAATTAPPAAAAMPPAETPAATPARYPEYAPDPEGARLAAKRGCLIYAAIVFALMTIALVAIYYWRYRDRPLLFAPASSAQVFPPTGSLTGGHFAV